MHFTKVNLNSAMNVHMIVNKWDATFYSKLNKFPQETDVLLFFLTTKHLNATRL